jgi:hypothetical protein
MTAVGKVEANGQIGDTTGQCGLAISVFSEMNGICGSAGAPGQDLLQKHPRGPAGMPVFFKHKPVDLLFFLFIEPVFQRSHLRRIPGRTDTGIKKMNLPGCQRQWIQKIFAPSNLSLHLKNTLRNINMIGMFSQYRFDTLEKMPWHF